MCIYFIVFVANLILQPHTSSQKSQFQRDGGSRDFQLPTGGFDFTPGFVRGSPRVITFLKEFLFQ